MGNNHETDSLRSTDLNCLVCGCVLGPESAEGLCPACLLGRAMEFSSSADEAGESDGMSAGSVLVGRSLGNYQLEALIAQGGMGAVYRAYDRKLNRPVALKVVQAGDSGSPALTERFRIETLAVSSLNHPHVIKIFETGVDQGWHYFAMEWVPGSSLRSCLRRSLMSFQAAAELIAKVALAVDHAHQRGVLHRDLKPGNVLIDDQGEPRLTDFGLAKMLEHESELTLTHSVLGTPAYMSPEQAKGTSRDITIATDVYGLGALLYELLCGSPPFTAANTPALLRCIVEQEPPPLRRRSRLTPPDALSEAALAIPPDLAVICLKCLEKSPARRYRTAGEVAEELGRWLRHEPILARPVSTLESAWKWMRRNPMAAILGLVLGAGILGIAGVSQVYGHKIAAGAEVQRKEMVQLQLETGDRYSTQNDPAGAILHFVSAWKADIDRPEREAFHRRRLGSTLKYIPALLHVWSHESRVNSVEWSPDGQWVLTASDDGTARLWPVGSEINVPIVLRHDGRVSYARFSPDGRWIATLQTNRSGRLWDRATGQPLGPEFDMSRPRFMPSTVPPFDFSPDSSTLLSISNRDARIRDIATGRVTGLPLQHTNVLNQAVFSPDGKRILTVTRDGMVGLWDVATRALISPSAQLRHPHGDAHTSGIFSPGGKTAFLVSLYGDARLLDAFSGESVAEFSKHPRLGTVSLAGFSASGDRLFTLGNDGTLNFWSFPHGVWIETIPPLPTGGIRTVSMADMSPDGRRAAVAALNGTVSLMELSNKIGAGVVLRHSDSVYGARFSPDGSKVVAGVGSGLVQVWSSKSGAPRIQVAHAGPVIASGYMDSGRRFFTASRDGSMRFYDASSGHPLGVPWVHPSGIARVRFDASGKFVAVGCEDGSVHVHERDSGRLRFPPLPHSRRPTWIEFSPDARTLLTLAGNPGNFTGDLRLWDVETGAPKCDSMRIPSLSKGGGFLPGGNGFFTWSDDGVVRFWDARTGLPRGEPLRPGEWVPEAAVSKDGQRMLVATSSSDNAPRPALVIDLASRRTMLRLDGHRSGVVRVWWSPDETHVLTASNDGSARNWDATSGLPVGRPLQQGGAVRSACYSVDGRWIATASEDRTARVWEAQTGLPTTPPMVHGGDVFDVSFSPDGNTLLTASEDGYARLWDLAPTDSSMEQVADKGALISGHRLNDTSGWVPLMRKEVEELWQRAGNGKR